MLKHLHGVNASLLVSAVGKTETLETDYFTSVYCNDAHIIIIVCLFSVTHKYWILQLHPNVLFGSLEKLGAKIYTVNFNQVDAS